MLNIKKCSKLKLFWLMCTRKKNIQFTIVIMVSRHQRTIYQGYSPSLALFLVTSRPRLTDQWFEIICVPDPIKIHIWATLWQCLKLQELGPKKYTFPIYLVFWWSTAIINHCKPHLAQVTKEVWKELPQWYGIWSQFCLPKHKFGKKLWLLDSIFGYFPS